MGTYIDDGTRIPTKTPAEVLRDRLAELRRLYDANIDRRAQEIIDALLGAAILHDGKEDYVEIPTTLNWKADTSVKRASEILDAPIGFECNPLNSRRTLRVALPLPPAPPAPVVPAPVPPPWTVTPATDEFKAYVREHFPGTRFYDISMDYTAEEILERVVMHVQDVERDAKSEQLAALAKALHKWRLFAILGLTATTAIAIWSFA